MLPRNAPLDSSSYCSCAWRRRLAADGLPSEDIRRSAELPSVCQGLLRGFGCLQSHSWEHLRNHLDVQGKILRCLQPN